MDIDLWVMICTGCGKEFYELDGDTLDSCPHCGDPADDQATGSKKTVQATADPRTGVITTIVDK